MKVRLTSEFRKANHITSELVDVREDKAEELVKAGHAFYVVSEKKIEVVEEVKVVKPAKTKTKVMKPARKKRVYKTKRKK